MAGLAAYSFSLLDEPTRQALAVVAEIATWTSQDINEFKAAFVDYYLHHDQAFFAQTEAQPLTLAQAKACIIQDDRQLLLAELVPEKPVLLKLRWPIYSIDSYLKAMKSYY